MSNYDVCEKEYLDQGERCGEDYENECDQCGQPCVKVFCSRACYDIGKADYDADQEK